MTVREYLFPSDPYAGFDHHAYDLDLSGFRLPESVLARVVEVRPKMVIEVGSWKGRSAIYLADRLRKHGQEAEIICVDTWLGAEEMWVKPERDDVPERYRGLCIRHGHPAVYEQFLANVLKSGHAGTITPLPNTSAIGARILGRIGTRAQFIFIDGSHEFKDAYGDLVAYWDLLDEGGMMVGDDLDWGGVGRALLEFQRRVCNCRIEAHSDQGWMIRKGGPQGPWHEALVRWLLARLKRSRPVLFFRR